MAKKGRIVPVKPKSQAGTDYRIPSRYTVKTDAKAGLVSIKDTQTGRTASLPMAHYGAVSNVLAQLLPDAGGPVAVTELKTNGSSAPTSSPTPAPQKAAKPAAKKAAAKAAKKTAPKTPDRPPADAKPGPMPAWVASHPEKIAETGFNLTRAQVKGTPFWGFEVNVGRKRVAVITAEEERRWVLSDAEGQRFPSSVHRNLIGVIARISAVVMPKLKEA